jgi:peptidoglycan/LPS O-acetylase OafA/YrhL
VKANEDAEARPGHIQRIDLLRALAIVMVFCFHGLEIAFGHEELPWVGDFRDYAAAQHPAFLTFYLFSSGKLGVALFFVISGFCIHLSFLKWEQRARLKPGNAVEPQRFIPQFYFRRFWRIYPVYLVALGVFASLSVPDLTSWKAVKMVTIHAALLHNFNQGHFFAINGAFWSIAVEWQLYLVYPLVICCRRYVGAISAFVGLILLGFLYPFYVPGVAGSDAWRFALSQMPFSYWPQWLIGAWVAERWVNRRPPIPGLRIWIYTTLVAYILMSQYRPTSGWSFGVAILLFALLIEACIRNTKPLTQIEMALLPVGLCSYSIYLFHCIMYKLLDWIHANVYQDRPYLDLSLSLTGIFMVILLPCWLSYRYLELGSVRMGNWLWQRLQKPVAGPIAATPPYSLAQGKVSESGV